MKSKSNALRKQADPIPLRVTQFHDAYSKTPITTHDFAWDEFVEDLPNMLAVERRNKNGLPGLVYAEVREHLCNANTSEHTALAIDVDDAPKQFLRDLERKGLRCAAYESPSSGLPGKGLRLRVIMSLTAAVPPHAVRAARTALARELGLDPSASGVDGADAISQLMFAGRLRGTPERQVWSFDGSPWTPPAPGEAPTEGNPATYREQSAPDRDADEVPRFPRALVKAISPAPGDTQRRGGRKAMRAIGGYYARQGWHPDAIALAVEEQVPSDQPGVRADEAREAAEQFYAGDPKTAGANAIGEHFGADVLAALDKATVDPWFEMLAARWRSNLEKYGRVTGPRRTGADKDDEASAGAVLECVSWRDIMAPLPDVDWLCERLGIAAGGRPNLFAAAPGAGKTLSAQALALAVASGSKLFGEFECARGSVLHIDLDQGRGATLQRYQMLARGLRLRTSDAVDLECSFFGLSLTRGDQIDAKAVETLTRTVRGKTLVIVDSLRALAPGIDENASEFGAVLTELSKISHNTGATWLVIHHSGKGDAATAAVRGSSAIRGAAGCIWHLTRADADAPLIWRQDKATEWAIDTARPLATVLEKAPGFGLQLCVAPDDVGAGNASGEPTLDERRQIAEIVAKHRDGVSEEEIAMSAKPLGIPRARCRGLVKVMVSDGELRSEGARTKFHRIYLEERGRELFTEQA